MARQTRQQRQQRRQQDGTAPAAEKAAQPSSADRARQRQAQIRPGAQPIKSQAGQQRRERGGARRFLAESWGELQKVEWPGQSQVIQGTVVVLVACIIVGLFLYASDEAFKHLVKEVFLR